MFSKEKVKPKEHESSLKSKDKPRESKLWKFLQGYTPVTTRKKKK